MSLLKDNPLPSAYTDLGISPQEREFFVPVSPEIKALERLTRDTAGSDHPLLILGESGTGKASLGIRLHQWSSRAAGRIWEVECKDITLGEFDRVNRSFEISGSGAGSVLTFIFREVSLLPDRCQEKLKELLSEALRTREERLGCSRFVFTTRASLEQEVRLGHFREDLYYQISGISLRIPPLRHRREDIRFLFDKFLEKYASLLHRPKPALSAAALHFFDEYPWPGNIRELEDAARTVAAVGDERLALTALKPNNRTRRLPDRIPATSLKEASRAASRAAEKEMILRVLSRTRWNRKRAAGELKISYKALLYKLKQMGVQDPVVGPVGENS